MKRILHVSSESGFILPSVLLVTAIVFVYLTSAILTFQQELAMTSNIIQQTEAQTLFQMAYTQYKKDTSENNKEENINYSFPSGHVSITTTKLEDVLYLQLEMNTVSGYREVVTKSLQFE